MSVTSTTLAGVNVWQFSGAVTDAEIKTAWAALIVNNRYKPGRYIYIDSTCSLVNVRGTYYVDCEALGIILHSSRNKANTVFSNWVLTQTVGLAVGSRNLFVRFYNGSAIVTGVTDGIDMKGGAMIYAVQGNPGGADPRYLNEMMFGSLDGTVITSAAYTEQEMEPSSIGTIWRGLKIQKCAGFPLLQGSGGLQRQVVYRCEINVESATLRIVRPYYSNSVCYVSSLIRRQGAPVTSNIGDTYSSGAAVIMMLNNWLDEGWFGASKTSFTFSNWSAGNRIIGGVMKKIQVQPSTLVRTYDSRSTAVSQKSTFSETTSDFLDGTGTTNLALYSEQLDNGYWTKGNTTIAANDINSPIGTLTADKVREDAVNAQHRINTTAMTAVSGQPYTYSFYAKASERSFVHVRMISSGTTTNAEACFNLTAGTVLNGTGTSTITNVGNGWFRCTITGNPTTTSVICYANMALSSSLTVPVYTGTTNSGLHLWGHQFERSSVATDYIATTATTADGGYSTTADASTGRAQIVCVGGIATGGSQTITRYSGQKFTLQKFGYKVQIETPDMTFGDDDLSAYSPITMTEQDGISRTQSAITSATSINSFQELLEELHVLAIGLVGSASYSGYANGNLFNFSGGVLTTNFTTVNVDATAASKISYNSKTNTLTIKSSTLAANSTVTAWNNSVGAVNLLNGAKITGVYETSAGVSVVLQLRDISNNGRVCLWNPSTSATELYQTNSSGSAQTYTIYFPPGSAGLQKKVARELYGFQRYEETITLAAGEMWWTATDIPDVGIDQTNLSTVLAYTSIETPSKRYDRTAAFRLTEQGIKLGQIATRSGTSIEGTFSVVVRDDAAAVYSIAGNVMTIKANSYDFDNKYTKEIITGGGTFTAYDTEPINISIEDANGDSTCSVQGTVGGLVDVWKCVNGTVNADYATGTKIASNISAGNFRWIGLDGYKLIFYDKNTLLARDCSMSKGTYTLGWYVYDVSTGGLTQDQNADFAALVTRVLDIYTDVNSITAGFVESNDSLHAISDAVDLIPQNVWTKPIEAGYTAEQMMRIMAAESAGTLRDAGTEVETFTGIDGVTDRIIADVDEFGNRTAITLNAD